jgi:acetoacetyl-CoA synthetase
MDADSTPLWRPDEARIRAARITDYRGWLAAKSGRAFASYDDLWKWSVAEPGSFWDSIWHYFDVVGKRGDGPALAGSGMPGAKWFPGASLNYVDQVLKHASDARPAIVAGDERGGIVEIGWDEIVCRTAALAATLRTQGIQRGDRVAAYLPNTPETVVAFLAVASLGAIWSLCSPDMGVRSVLDRFRQIEPKALIACDGYRFGGRVFDRRGVVDWLRRELPTVRTYVHVQCVEGPSSLPDGAIAWADATTGAADPVVEAVPFDHPLWIVYSSGTTGLPKPIVHGHGGIVLEHTKLMALHNDLGAADRYHWYSSTGWIMWNCQIGGLLVGSTICLYDGSATYPDAGALWRFVGSAGATFFGAGAAFHGASMKAGVGLRASSLARLRTVGSTGSPLSSDAYRWLQSQLGQRVFINPISGGTDVASAFVGGVCTLPVHAGEMQARCLGAHVEAWNADGKPVVGEIGELVCVSPMPSMPLCFWNDPDGQRYRDSYFDMFAGVWRHGDWIEITRRGGAIIYGRSDATINRGGIRLGTSELYSAVEALPEIVDSLVVDLEYLGRPSYMPLFVVLAEGCGLDTALVERIEAAIRAATSPRHVPNAIVEVPQVPRTLSGKKLEVPIKRLLLGEPLDRVVNLDAVANPEALAWFARFARERDGAAG